MRAEVAGDAGREVDGMKAVDADQQDMLDVVTEVTGFVVVCKCRRCRQLREQRHDRGRCRLCGCRHFHVSPRWFLKATIKAAGSDTRVSLR